MNRRAPLRWLPLILVAQVTAYVWVGPDGVQGALRATAAWLTVPYNTLVVTLGVGLLGLASGVIGSFAVLRQRSLTGDAVAHAALPGLCLAYLAVGSRQFGAFLVGAVISGLLGVMVLAWLQKNTRLKADAVTGLVLSVFYGVGIVLSRIIQDDPSGQQAGLDSFLLGKTAGMVSQDVLFVAVIAANVLLLTALFYKEIKLLIFDHGFAAVQGWPVLALDALVLGLLVLTVVIGLPAVGVVLMAAMVIIPGVSARFWTDRLGTMLALAGLFGLLTGLIGTQASAIHPDLPAGGVIVLAGAAIFFASMLFSPRRGVLARFWQQLRFREKVARQNLLRALYEAAEPALPEMPPVTIEDVLARRAWRAGQARRLLRQAAKRGEVAAADDHWRLTEPGLHTAAQIVKSHRLWETFLVHQADIATDHVDRDADEIEHVLTPAMLARLEEQLQTDGRWPMPAVPSSVHPLAEPAGAAKSGA